MAAHREDTTLVMAKLFLHGSVLYIKELLCENVIRENSDNAFRFILTWSLEKEFTLSDKKLF